MRLKKTLTAIPLAAVLAAAGCGGSGSSGDDATQGGARADAGSAVTIKTFNFKPDPIRIKRGETVVWTNEDSTVHTVTTGPRGNPDGRLDERLDASGGTARMRFDERGRHRYFCSLHSGPGMEAEVIVE